MADTGHMDAAVISDADRGRHRRSRFFGLIPGFVYILALFIFGQLFFSDPRAILFDFGGYRLAWVEVLLVTAAVMGAIAIIQVVLFALAAAKVQGLAMFDNTEFLLLTIINMAQTAVAYQINSATLMRTIASGA
jgi:hypothetical protein